MNGSRYLLLKASADRIPLMDNSVGLVIATPPMLGVRHRPKSDYCTSDGAEYDLLIRNFLMEATRVVQPRRHILLIDRKLQSRRSSRSLVFHILHKQAAKGGGMVRRVRSETFLTHFVDIKEYPWWAISLGMPDPTIFGARRNDRARVFRFGQRRDCSAAVGPEADPDRLALSPASASETCEDDAAACANFCFA